jgi:C_GCAxxG_C_C family probable redox protein
MDGREAVQRAQELFLDDRNVYGCTEVTFIVLKEAFGLPDSEDSSSAMALNGGVAYSGGICGAISGAAMAIGLLAGRRIADHRAAKRAAHLIISGLIDDFDGEHGAVDCRDLLGMEVRTKAQHAAFIESGIWRDVCMRQVEFSVRLLTPLADEGAWAQALRDLEARQP